tara:strand:- start:19 stop:207 length:189 start_codon:yes stop_codon:yes gene_type:complete
MTIKEALMATQFTSSQTEAKIVKAIKALSLTQKNPPSKLDFVSDAIDAYIASLIQDKFIKSI